MSTAHVLRYLALFFPDHYWPHLMLLTVGQWPPPIWGQITLEAPWSSGSKVAPLLKRDAKAAPQASEKQQNSIPKFIKRDFRGKSIFAIPSMRKPRFGSPKHRNFDSEFDKKMTAKQAPKKRIFMLLEHKKLIYTGPKTIPKSSKIV